MKSTYISYPDGSELKLDKQLDGWYSEGKKIDFEVVKGKNGQFTVFFKQQTFELFLLESNSKKGSQRWMINGKEVELGVKTDLDKLLSDLGMDNLDQGALKEVQSPMPGMVLSIAIKEGQEVTEGEALIVLESMKMENVLKANQSGIIKSINCEAGKSVEKNELLLIFE